MSRIFCLIGCVVSFNRIVCSANCVVVKSSKLLTQMHFSSSRIAVSNASKLYCGIRDVVEHTLLFVVKMVFVRLLAFFFNTDSVQFKITSRKLLIVFAVNGQLCNTSMPNMQGLMKFAAIKTSMMVSQSLHICILQRFVPIMLAGVPSAVNTLFLHGSKNPYVVSFKSIWSTFMMVR